MHLSPWPMLRKSSVEKEQRVMRNRLEMAKLRGEQRCMNYLLAEVVCHRGGIVHPNKDPIVALVGLCSTHPYFVFPKLTRQVGGLSAIQMYSGHESHNGSLELLKRVQ